MQNKSYGLIAALGVVSRRRGGPRQWSGGMSTRPKRTSFFLPPAGIRTRYSRTKAHCANSRKSKSFDETSLTERRCPQPDVPKKRLRAFFLNF